MLVFRSLLARWPLALQAVLAVGLVLGTPVEGTSTPMLTCLVAWLVSGHWLLNNILACALACFITATVRLPNARVGAVLLCGLFVYDIFWVFFSSAFFGQNVMVSVANNQASNPVAGAAQALRIPSSFISATLELPAKLLVPVGLHGGFVGLGTRLSALNPMLRCGRVGRRRDAWPPPLPAVQGEQRGASPAHLFCEYDFVCFGINYCFRRHLGDQQPSASASLYCALRAGDIAERRAGKRRILARMERIGI